MQTFLIILTAFILLGWRIRHLQSVGLTEKGNKLSIVLQITATVFAAVAFLCLFSNNHEKQSEILLAGQVFKWIAFSACFLSYIWYFIIWFSSDKEEQSGANFASTEEDY